MSKDNVFRVEFVGPMGAGKSTICNELIPMLQHKYGKRMVKLAQDEKKRIILSNIRNESLLKYILLKQLIKIPVLSSNLIKENLSSYSFKELSNRSKELKKFLKLVYFEDRTGEYIDADNMILRNTFFIRDLMDLLLFDKYSKNKIILHDEFLFQRGLSFAFGEKNCERFIHKFVEHSPKPDVLIVAKAPLDILKKRIIERGREVDRLLNDLEESIEKMKYFISACERFDVAILQINSSDNFNGIINDCLDQIDSEINNKQV